MPVSSNSEGGSASPSNPSFIELFCTVEARTVKNAFLVGSQVYLRPIEAEDGPVFAQWLNDAEVRRTLNRQNPISLRIEQEWIESTNKDERTLSLAIVIKESERLIGGAGLREIDFVNRHAVFGICLGDKNEWDKGYGTETLCLLLGHAFETMNLHRVSLHVLEHNKRGQRCYEKAGFVREGVLRQETFREGRYWDTVVMAILREEWREKKKEKQE
jgi:RimJ/RimL family protein N-acetyltransferase